MSAMSKTYLVIYGQSDNAELRDSLRPAHIAYRKSLGEGLILAGPLLSDDNGPVGSVIIVSAPDRDSVMGIVLADPFVAAGVLVVQSVTAMRIAMIAPQHAG